MGQSVPLIPREDNREAALFFVVCALCFLAALAVLSARSTYGAAAAWTAEVEGELTVSLHDTDRLSAEQARDLILTEPGITAATVLPKEEIDALLAPSFGSRGLPETMPLPQLIAVTAEPDTLDIGPNLNRRLTEAGFTAAVDEHATWAGDIHRMLALVRWIAFSAIGLLGATAIAVIAFATHAALLARRDIVDVLHLSGAEDRFIANLFERRFWVLGLRAGAIGALSALGLAAFRVYFGGQQAGRSALLPQLSLGYLDVIILVLTPVIAGFAARAAAHLTVMRALKATV